MLDVAEQHGFRFDAVQMPLNVLDAHFESFEQGVLPRLTREGIGVLGMKPLAAGRVFARDGLEAAECLRYAMSLPTSTVINGCDSLGALEQALAVALDFRPLSGEERDELLARSRPLEAAGGGLEEFKTTTKHDGTTTHPHWLEAARL